MFPPIPSETSCRVVFLPCEDLDRVAHAILFPNGRADSWLARTLPVFSLFPTAHYQLQCCAALNFVSICKAGSTACDGLRPLASYYALYVCAAQCRNQTWQIFQHPMQGPLRFTFFWVGQRRPTQTWLHWLCLGTAFSSTGQHRPAQCNAGDPHGSSFPLSAFLAPESWWMGSVLLKDILPGDCHSLSHSLSEASRTNREQE